MAGSDQRCVLVVDDDPKIRTLLKTYLEDETYRVLTAEDGAAMRRLLAKERVDLILLDLMLPGENGLTLVRELNDSHQIPVIMVTGKGSVTDKVVGLEFGAEDYIAKPFHLREVLARIRTVLRRADGRPQNGAKADAEVLRFAGWRFDPVARTLTGEAGRVDLTAAEFDLLSTFIAHPSRPLSRDQLLDLTKGRDWSPFDRSIDTQVGRLRKKIEADPAQPQIIKTVRGVGYCFSARLDRG